MVGFKVGFYDFCSGELDKKPGGFYYDGWVDANPVWSSKKRHKNVKSKERKRPALSLDKHANLIRSAIQ